VLGEPRKPNVVLIYTDDQGTLDAGCYGAHDLHTPAIDRLAETGVRFTQAYAHTVCCPSRAMLLTGRHPQRSGVTTWVQGNPWDDSVKVNLDRAEVTLADALKSAGYRTALCGKWHLGADADHGPTERGFDEFTGILGGFVDNYVHFFLHGDGYHDLYEGKEEIFARGTYFPDLTTDRALRFIDRNRDRPFFLYLAFNIPHYPEQPDSRFDALYRDLPEPRRSYARMISTTDDRIGRVLDMLEETGLRDDTVVIMMSDNGHSTEDYRIVGDDHASGLPAGADYGAHGGGGFTGKWRGAKGSFFEGGLRVPAIVSYPRILPQGTVRDQAITACDWYPTILELCGVPCPDVQLDGSSLVPVIDSDAPSHHEVMHWQWQNDWAVRGGDWKLIGKDDRAEFLGSLVGSAPEQENLLAAQPALVERLTNLHAEWAERVRPRDHSP